MCATPFAEERRTEESSDFTRRLSVKTASESIEKFVVTFVGRKNYCVDSDETKDLLCYLVCVMNFKFVGKIILKPNFINKPIYRLFLFRTIYLFFAVSFFLLYAKVLCVLSQILWENVRLCCLNSVIRYNLHSFRCISSPPARRSASSFCCFCFCLYWDFKLTSPMKSLRPYWYDEFTFAVVCCVCGYILFGLLREFGTS